MTDAPRLKRIYVDTNAFIQAFEYQGPVSALLVSLFLSQPDRDRQLLVTSHLTLSELQVKPFELGRDDLVRLYDNWTISNEYIEAVPIVREILRDAARLRAQEKSLKLADATHITTALGTACTHFLTNDTRIKGGLGLEVVRLTEPDIRDLQSLIANGR